MKSTFKRNVAIATVVCFVGSMPTGYSQQASAVVDAVSSSVVQEGVASRVSSGLLDASRIQISPDLNPYLITIPKEAGKIDEVYQGQPDAPLVVLIQDVHANYEAQLNIKEILAHLVGEHDISLVQMEGTISKLDPEILRPSYLEETNQRLIDFLLREGRITGADAFSVEAEDGVSFYGVEDPTLYYENLRMFRSIYAHRDEVNHFFDTAHKMTDKIGRKLLSPGLLDFTRKTEAFSLDKIDLLDYLIYLNELSERSGLISLKRLKEMATYPNLVRLMRLFELENEFDSAVLVAEVKDLRSDIGENMELTEETQALINRIERREKGMRPRAYYTQLAQLADEADVNLISYTQIQTLAEYLIYQDEVDHRGIFSELLAFESYLQDTLFKAEEEKTFVRLISFIDLLERYFRLEMSREKLGLYLENQAEMKPSWIESKLRKMAQTHGINFLEMGNANQMDSYMGDLEYFYRIVLKRDEVFAEKIDGKMKELGVRKTALVSGGFHREGLVNQFRSDNYSYVVISPNVDVTEGNQNYVKVMLDDASVAGGVFAGTFATALDGYTNPSQVVTRAWVSVLGDALTRVWDADLPEHEYVVRSNNHAKDNAPITGFTKQVTQAELSFGVRAEVRSEVHFYSLRDTKPIQVTSVARYDKRTNKYEVEFTRRFSDGGALRHAGVEQPPRYLAYSPSNELLTNLPTLADGLLMRGFTTPEPLPGNPALTERAEVRRETYREAFDSDIHPLVEERESRWIQKVPKMAEIEEFIKKVDEFGANLSDRSYAQRVAERPKPNSNLPEELQLKVDWLFRLKLIADVYHDAYAVLSSTENPQGVRAEAGFVTAQTIRDEIIGELLQQPEINNLPVVTSQEGLENAAIVIITPDDNNYTGTRVFFNETADWMLAHNPRVLATRSEVRALLNTPFRASKEPIFSWISSDDTVADQFLRVTPAELANKGLFILSQINQKASFHVLLGDVVINGNFTNDGPAYVAFLESDLQTGASGRPSNPTLLQSGDSVKASQFTISVRRDNLEISPQFEVDDDVGLLKVVKGWVLDSSSDMLDKLRNQLPQNFTDTPAFRLTEVVLDVASVANVKASRGEVRISGSLQQAPDSAQQLREGVIGTPERPFAFVPTGRLDFFTTNIVNLIEQQTGAFGPTHAFRVISAVDQNEGPGIPADKLVDYAVNRASQATDANALLTPGLIHRAASNLGFTPAEADLAIDLWQIDDQVRTQEIGDAKIFVVPLLDTEDNLELQVLALLRMLDDYQGPARAVVYASESVKREALQILAELGRSEDESIVFVEDIEMQDNATVEDAIIADFDGRNGIRFHNEYLGLARRFPEAELDTGLRLTSFFRSPARFVRVLRFGEPDEVGHRLVVKHPKVNQLYTGRLQVQSPDIRAAYAEIEAALLRRLPNDEELSQAGLARLGALFGNILQPIQTKFVTETVQFVMRSDERTQSAVSRLRQIRREALKLARSA